MAKKKTKIYKQKQKRQQEKLAYKKRLEKLIERAKTDVYSEYRLEATKRGIAEHEMFSRGEYTNIVAAINTSINPLPSDPATIAERQTYDGSTRNQVSAKFIASQRLDPGKYRDEDDFIKRKGFRDIDERIAAIADANPHLTGNQLSLLITSSIFSPK